MSKKLGLSALRAGLFWGAFWLMLFGLRVMPVARLVTLLQTVRESGVEPALDRKAFVRAEP